MLRLQPSQRLCSPLRSVTKKLWTRTPITIDHSFNEHARYEILCCRELCTPSNDQHKHETKSKNWKIDEILRGKVITQFSLRKDLISHNSKDKTSSKSSIPHPPSPTASSKTASTSSISTDSSGPSSPTLTTEATATATATTTTTTTTPTPTPSNSSEHSHEHYASLLDITYPKDRRGGKERLLEPLRQFFLPDGFPNSVSMPDYIQYQKWQIAQSVACSMMTVLSTHALLVAVGINAGEALPAAATIQWILKDGTSYLGKILSSNYGYNFDWDPKRYRMLAEIFWSLGILLEIATPAAPQYFLMIAASANLLKGVSSVAAGATRVAINQRLSRRNNLADVTAKAESQAVCAQIAGMALGIGLFSTPVGESVLGAILAYFALTSFHLFANYRALRHVQLHSLNQPRALAVIRSYLDFGDTEIPSPWKINTDQSILFPSYSADPRSKRIVIGARLEHLLSEDGSKEQAEHLDFLLKLFYKERYVLNFNKKSKCILVAFHAQATMDDQLRSLLQASYILNVLKKKRREYVPEGSDSPANRPKSFFGRLKAYLFSSRSVNSPSASASLLSRLQQLPPPTTEEVRQWLKESLEFTEANFEKFKAALECRGWETKYLYAEVSSSFPKLNWKVLEPVETSTVKG